MQNHPKSNQLKFQNFEFKSKSKRAFIDTSGDACFIYRSLQEECELELLLFRLLKLLLLLLLL